MNRQFLTLLVAATASILFLASGQVSAEVLVTEDFSYPDGSLVPNGGWTNHSGTEFDLLVAAGQAVVQHGDPSEDANINFGDVATGVLTASFDIVVNDDTKIGDGGTDFEYFAHFFTSGEFNFRSRVDVVAPSGAVGDYTLGISSTSSTAEATLPVDFAFGDVVPVTIAFDHSTGIGSLTVGGDTVSGTSTALGETLNQFALRQSDSTNNETVLVDNLVITGTLVPEPSSCVLLLAGLLTMLVARRR